MRTGTYKMHVFLIQKDYVSLNEFCLSRFALTENESTATNDQMHLHEMHPAQMNRSESVDVSGHLIK